MGINCTADELCKEEQENNYVIWINSILSNKINDNNNLQSY